ncbi:MAG: iron ABC transporter permease [Gammaproteobacteria bacterium]|nr:iron ABC transporter permease [Gammaproteobacteria bacterium]
MNNTDLFQKLKFDRRLAAGVFLLIMAGSVLLPLGVLGLSWLEIDQEIWAHLLDIVLPSLLVNTLVLLVGVGVLVLLLGVSLAWLTAVCEFPGRKFFDWALMLPLAMPTYVIAFVMVGLLDYSGSLQTFLRGLLGPTFSFPEIRSGGGVVLVLGLVLYPYVYMLARSAFQSQGRGLLDAARVLGYGPWRGFYKVALPMARPAIAGGAALALMEVLADFGAVSVFNYDTFTTAIYKTWYGFFNIHAAGQLASLLLLFVVLALSLERRSRGDARYHQSGKGQRIALMKWKGWAAALFCLFVLSCAFIVPVVKLLMWVVQNQFSDLDERYLKLLAHSFGLAALAAIVTVGIAFVLALIKKTQSSTLVASMVQWATLGYALPGSILAVGIMLSFTFVDKGLGQFYLLLGYDSGPLLVGGVVALVLAYVVRFMAVAFGAIDSGFEQLRPSIIEGARTLGASWQRLLRRIYLPMLAPGLLTAMVLVFVDVMKEMPATLLLRPFGWDTLAVRVYEMTSEGEWERAALPGITLVVAGLIPVLFLVQRSAR